MSCLGTFPHAALEWGEIALAKGSFARRAPPRGTVGLSRRDPRVRPARSFPPLRSPPTPSLRCVMAAAAAARGLAKRWLRPAAASRAVSPYHCSCSCPCSCAGPCPCPCPCPSLGLALFSRRRRPGSAVSSLTLTRPVISPPPAGSVPPVLFWRGSDPATRVPGAGSWK